MSLNQFESCILQVFTFGELTDARVILGNAGHIKEVFLEQGVNIYNLYSQCYYPKYPADKEKLAG